MTMTTQAPTRAAKKNGKAKAVANGAKKQPKAPYNFTGKDPVIEDLRRMLTSREITNKALAANSGRCTSTVRNIFYGETKRPQFATIQSLAMALGWRFVAVKKDN